MTLKSVKSKKGMTLIEILIVVTLLGILAGVLVRSLGSSLEAGREASARTFITKTFRTALEGYRAVNGSYPDPGGGYNVLNPFLANDWIKTPWGGDYAITLSKDPQEIGLSYKKGDGKTTVTIKVFSGEVIKE